MKTREIISVIIAGILYVLAFPPFDFKSSIYISLVIFLGLILTESKKNALILSSIYGLVIFSLGASWIFNSIYTYGNGGIVISSILTLVFILIQSSYFLIVGFFVNKKYFDGRNIFFVFAPASFWVLMEFTRSYLLTGFPWLIIGHSQIHTIFDNVFPILGSFFVSYIVVLVCTYLAVMFFIKKSFIHNKFAFISLAIIISIFQFETNWTEKSSESVSIAVVQPNIKQDDKFNLSNIEIIKQKYASLSNNLENDLIILPETALPVVHSRGNRFYRDKIIKRADGMISGIFRREGNDIFNSMLLLDEREQYYDKRHLVPFGEYTPLKALLEPLAQTLNIPMSNLSTGDFEQNSFTFKNFEFIPIICYESAYSSLIETNDEDYSIIVNISNDSWFGNSFAPYQHLQITQVRALEFQRNLIRAANTGISAIIDKNGVITKKLEFNTLGVIESNISADRGSTPFSRFGDYPILMLISIIIIFYVVKTSKHE